MAGRFQPEVNPMRRIVARECPLALGGKYMKKTPETGRV